MFHAISQHGPFRVCQLLEKKGEGREGGGRGRGAGGGGRRRRALHQVRTGSTLKKTDGTQPPLGYLSAMLGPVASFSPFLSPVS